MGLLHYLWSKTAASNSTADAQINWAEGMAPSAVNDSARAMMASLAGYRDDISGAIVTGGTSTAFTVTSNQIFNSLANMSGQVIAFSPHATNGATVTLNVDGLGAKPLRPSPGVELVAGVLIEGTPYTALYDNSDEAWYLRNSFVNPYTVPIGGMMPYIGATAPSSSFVFPYGQNISRTTYSALFSLISTGFGAGDGSTTFGLPDLRGRVPAGVDTMGGSAASRLTAATMNGTGLGSVSSATETKALATANLPPYTPAGSVSTSLSANANQAFWFSGAGNLNVLSGAVYSVSAITASSTFTGTAQGGTSTAFAIVQPTITLNYILRVL
jgi:microcystin-dependent protein